MTTTTRSAGCNAPGTTLMLAFDLGSTKWTLGFTTAPAQRPRIRTMPAGDLGTLVKEMQLAKARFGLALGVPVRSCYEAGRDGFWLHRWLLAHEVENVVVDSSSIELNRRARRAKTDRLDVSKLWGHLEAIDARMTALTAARDAAIETGTDRVAATARQLCTMRGVAETSAAVFSAELFGTRTFQNGRQIGAVMGLVPVPYRSDQRVRDQGISRAGRAELRRIALQLAWGWVRWQPTSALTQWFVMRCGPAGGRSKRIGIVGLARKLAIALWRYVEHGVVTEGATLKA